MDALYNPYTPGAGIPPPVLTGRQQEIEQFQILLARLENGLYEKPMALYGLRGVGKTVLLNEFIDIAIQQGWAADLVEVTQDINFRKSMSQISSTAAALLTSKAHKVKDKLTRLRKAQLSLTLSATSEGNVGTTVSLSSPSEPGDVEANLVGLFAELGAIAKESGKGVVFFFDELQLLGDRELEALIAALHRVGQRGLPVTIVAAGLPNLRSKLISAKTYAERLFMFRRIAGLSKQAAFDALTLPAKEQEVLFEQDAANMTVEYSEGYPYFLQAWGKTLWNLASESPITADDVDKARPLVLSELDDEFFAVRYERATPSERKYLLGLASLGEGPQSSTEASKAAGYSVSRSSPIRRSLIDKGLIYSPESGQIEFTVPHFSGYLSAPLVVNTRKASAARY